MMLSDTQININLPESIIEYIESGEFNSLKNNELPQNTNWKNRLEYESTSFFDEHPILSHIVNTERELVEENSLLIEFVRDPSNLSE